MAAPESEKKFVVCDRCRASVAPTEASCPECGAPMRTSTAIPAEAPPHSDLARANLLRVRGDLKGAEALCLATLRRYPNNDAAHVLMGDIAADREQWPSALEWYELALDLNPESVGVRAKADEARRLMRELDETETVEQLGLPTRRQNPALVAAGVAGLILIFALAAFVAGRGVRGGHSPGEPSLRPIVASKEPANIAPPAAAPETPTPAPDPAAGTSPSAPTPTPTSTDPIEDRAARDALARTSAEAGRILEVQRDPRAGLLAITYSAPEGQDERRIGAQLAKDAIDALSDVTVVTLRAIRSDRIVYLADVYRSRVAELEAQNPPPADWPSAVLTREWPVRSAPSGAASTR